MADEPAIPASRVSDAHDAMEGQPDPSCFSLSESGVSMRNGTTERLCQPTTFPSEAADSGPERSLTCDSRLPLRALAPPPADSARPLSSAALRVLPAPPGSDHPRDVQFEVAYRWNRGGEGDAELLLRDSSSRTSDAADATAAALAPRGRAARPVAVPDCARSARIGEVGTPSLLAQKSALGLVDRDPSDGAVAPVAPCAPDASDRLGAVGAAQVCTTRGRSPHAASSGVQDSILDPLPSPEPPQARGASVPTRGADAASSPSSAFAGVRGARGAPAQFACATRAGALARLRAASHDAQRQCASVPAAFVPRAASPQCYGGAG